MGVQELCPLLGCSLANPWPRAFLASLSHSTPWGRLLATDPDPQVCIGKRRSSSVHLCPPVPAPARTPTRRHKRQPCAPLLWTQGIRARVSRPLTVCSAGAPWRGHLMSIPSMSSAPLLWLLENCLPAWSIAGYSSHWKRERRERKMLPIHVLLH